MDSDYQLLGSSGHLSVSHSPCENVAVNIRLHGLLGMICSEG